MLCRLGWDNRRHGSINMPTVNDVVSVLEQLAPPNLAAGWDNVGLLLGDRTHPVHQALTCLTLTPEVAEEAVAAGAELIITHHPIMFRGVKRLTSNSAEGRTILKLAQARIAVYSPHTAWDDCRGGINDQLAAKLGLTNVTPLRPAGQELFKLVVFVPDSDLAKVADAMFAAGAGVIGQYRECSYRLAGTGTFFGGDATNPAVGSKGRREEVPEWRLEVQCPKSQLEKAVAGLRAAHSYEEPAFDVYPLAPISGAAGSGRVGELPKPMPLGELAGALRRSLSCGPIQLVGDSGRSVRCVALACGAGGEFLDDARRAAAEVFITGEMRFHDYLAAQASCIGLILPGHFATERFAMEWLAEWLLKQLPGLSAAACLSEKDPVNWI